MLDFKIAFQGGGAKLLSLLSAVEACQNKAAEDVEVEFKEVAGASAGSIAALILGLGIDVKEIRERFASGEGRRLVESMAPPRSSVGFFARLALGQPLFSERHLETFIYNLCEMGGI